MTLRYNTLALVFLSFVVLYLTQASPGGSEGLGWAEFTLREDAREEKSKFLFLDVPANLCEQGTLCWPESLSRCFT